ncbi:MAG TPA: DUF983 domain-containing protein [Phenylobacterium sp.]|uniref:DUF983 domain-containing protein n=1 Tax=Phenylobacterium sp. TaxID=1871053 RepID=UPI002B48ED38|nr:DUF983 domain-containing protein [Phenylobacterium sp.]HKR88151.1 DUF983 domain-containing protein [Phenylobacterium sp.]
MPELVHPLRRSVFRGLRGLCPGCGAGRIFRAYLKVNEQCPTCALDLAHYPADDGPAYVTILLIGHLIVAPMLFFPIVWRAPAMYTAPIALCSLTGLTLLALPVIKGGWIGLMYALGVKDRDAALHTADAAD